MLQGNQKNQAGEGASGRAETALQKLISGQNRVFAVERDEKDAEQDHGERQTQVDLHELHACFVTLTGNADHGDGLMACIAVRDPEIGFQLISVDGFCFVFDVPVDEGVESILASVGDTFEAEA